MERLTVHEALCFIKVADKRISDAIDNCAFCASNKESSPKVNGVPVKEFEDDVKAKYQSIQDLIKRTEKIKAAPEPVQCRYEGNGMRQGDDRCRSDLYDAVRHSDKDESTALYGKQTWGCTARHRFRKRPQAR